MDLKKFFLVLSSVMTIVPFAHGSESSVLLVKAGLTMANVYGADVDWLTSDAEAKVSKTESKTVVTVSDGYDCVYSISFNEDSEVIDTVQDCQ